jgi:hypothetical protein
MDNYGFATKGKRAKERSKRASRAEDIAMHPHVLTELNQRLSPFCTIALQTANFFCLSLYLFFYSFFFLRACMCNFLLLSDMFFPSLIFFFFLYMARPIQVSPKVQPCLFFFLFYPPFSSFVEILFSIYNSICTFIHSCCQRTARRERRSAYSISPPFVFS